MRFNNNLIFVLPDPLSSINPIVSTSSSSNTGYLNVIIRSITDISRSQYVMDAEVEDGVPPITVVSK